MAISIKSEREIELMKEAGRILALTHEELKKAIKPGITTYEIDKLGEEVIRSYGCIPSFLNYNGYPASICVSVNEEVVHGIPSKTRFLKEGDIVSLDAGVIYEGYHSDAARTYGVGKISPENEHLIAVTKQSFFEAMKAAVPGNHIRDIGRAVEQYVLKFGYGIVEDLVGHGVGANLHEDPEVPNYGKKGTGVILKEGMTIAVEPMLNLGTREVYLLDDDWTIVTGDNKPSAHFEHTIIVTDDGYEILTGDDKCE